MLPSSLSTPSLDDALLGELAALRDDNLERTLRTVGHRRGAAVRTASGDAVDFSSNDYLGLASDARLVTAMSQSLTEQGVRHFEVNTSASDPDTVVFIESYDSDELHQAHQDTP